jgi:hypothetical protein
MNKTILIMVILREEILKQKMDNKIGIYTYINTCIYIYIRMYTYIYIYLSNTF